MKYCENNQNVAQRHKMSRCYWEKGTHKLSWVEWVATSLQLKKPQSVCVLTNGMIETAEEPNSDNSL